MGRPYFIALFDIITRLLETHTGLRIAGAVDGVLDFIFDNNPRLAATVPHWYQYTRSLLHPIVKNSIGGAPRFEDDKDFLPLQAADAQSWYYRRLFSERLRNEPFKKELPKELFAPLDTIPSAMSFWGPERMCFAVDQANQGRTTVERLPSRRFKDVHDIVANADLG